MKLLLVSLVDDNFGDNLIGICFRQLMKVVLKNHGLDGSEVQVNRMALRDIDESLVRTSDAIFFAGGGIVGLSYLGFNDYVDRITSIAEENEIPVVFSSLGINNMDANEENADQLRQILDRSCVKAIAVRENVAEFRKYSSRADLELVSDPAVWTKWVYGVEPRRDEYTVGINVVRGGLFRANDRDWATKDEFEYLKNLRELLDGAGIASRFYTNGSNGDHDTLRLLAERIGVPDDQVIFPYTTREVVETVASFDAIASIRMHSSIVAYSFGIPTVTLAWNDKIPFFYEGIGHPDRALGISDWDSQLVFEKLQSFSRPGEDTEDGDDYEGYLMSLYSFLYRVVAEVVDPKVSSPTPPYDFGEVKRVLAEFASTIDEDATDLRYKLLKLEKRNTRSQNALREVRKELKGSQKRLVEARKKLDAQQREITSLNERLKSGLLGIIRRAGSRLRR